VQEFIDKKESSPFSAVSNMNGSMHVSAVSIKTRAAQEIQMKFRAFKTSLGSALAAAAFLTMTTTAQAQTAKPADSASMVKPPSSPDAGNARPNNPDNMPTKRPALPANSDRMLHNNPASDAIAK
jgi:hypothetical protein